MNKKYNWGIIGAGNIAHRFAKSLQNSQQGNLFAVASNTESKLNDFKNLYPHIITYNNYDELIYDPLVDIIYIANWHNDHFKWAKKSLLAEKAVLCEKPATLFASQIKELASIAQKKNVFFMEAMKTRMIPAILELKNLLNKNVIGDILRIENCFCYDISQAKNTRYLFDEKQGGILQDVGSYTLASILDYIRNPVQDIRCDCRLLKKIDVHDNIELVFESGQTAHMEVAMDEKKPAYMTIYGTLGKIICEPFYRPKKLIIQLNNGVVYQINKDYQYDDFFSEIEEVHMCLNNNCYESQKMSLSDSIQYIELLERIKEVINK